MKLAALPVIDLKQQLAQQLQEILFITFWELEDDAHFPKHKPGGS